LEGNQYCVHTSLVVTEEKLEEERERELSFRERTEWTSAQIYALAQDK
jgi:hypothetical protein